MKKYLILFALTVLVSCGKEVINEPENDVVEATPISFDLSANHPDMTKAVKSGWEAGDAIFVFFDNVAAPKHLKMRYNGSEWLSTEYNGATPTPGALGLKNGDTGNMRAVFLPFGSNATVSASGTDFRFSKTYYAYYLTATLPYTVVDNEVSGAFDMVIPDDFVQFFVEDADAVDEAYLLGTDAVIPVGVDYISADGTIGETSGTYMNDMPGYVYDNGTDPKGYIFTGKLNSSYAYTGSYYFSKTNFDETVRHDYFVTGKTISSHDAIKLPAASNIYAVAGIPNKGKWVRVGGGITVELGDIIGSGYSEAFGSYGKWYTCNHNCTKPEQLGTQYTFDQANTLGVTLPSKDQLETLVNGATWTWLTVHGQPGCVVKCSAGFLFLAAQSSTGGNYWSSTERSDMGVGNIKYAYDLKFVSYGNRDFMIDVWTKQYAVRPIQ